MSTYACSDLHGRLDLYNAINDWLCKDDKVIFAGDAIDRGSHCLDTSLAILDNPQWIYLKGNHEDLMVKAYKTKDFSLWFYNGGNKTFYDIKEKWGNPTPFYLSEIKHLPTWYYYENTRGDSVIVCHAGFTPDHMPSEYELLWDRNHFTDIWPSEDKFDHDIGVNATNTFIVHGHTPVQSIIDSDDDPKMMFYCGGHKVNIDLGSVWSGIAALVNLDTFDEHYFDQQGEIMHA